MVSHIVGTNVQQIVEHPDSLDVWVFHGKSYWDMSNIWIVFKWQVSVFTLAILNLQTKRDNQAPQTSSIFHQIPRRTGGVSPTKWRLWESLVLSTAGVYKWASIDLLQDTSRKVAYVTTYKPTMAQNETWELQQRQIGHHACTKSWEQTTCMGGIREFSKHSLYGLRVHQLAPNINQWCQQYLPRNNILVIIRIFQP